MTRAELIISVRGLCNEISTDSGALLSDAGNMLEFLNDATEGVMLDLIPVMPGQFLVKENVTLAAGGPTYTPTAKFWQIYKIAKNITGEYPRELDPIDPLDEPYYTEVAGTDSEPVAYYVLGDVVYWVPIPSSAKANYAAAWLVRPELAALPEAGPTYIPAVAHRLIAYKAAILVAVMLEKDTGPFQQLYEYRLAKVTAVWNARLQNKPRYVREAQSERSIFSAGIPTDRDVDW